MSKINISKRHFRRLVRNRILVERQASTSTIIYEGGEESAEIDEDEYAETDQENSEETDDEVSEQSDEEEIEYQNDNATEIFDGDADKKKKQLINDLKRIMVYHNLSDLAAKDILCALNNYGIKLPKSKKTLLKESGNNYNAVINSLGDGKFCYIGIEKNLQMCNDAIVLRSDKIILDFNIDGLPLCKSSKKCIWPILGALVQHEHVSPFVVACYSGTSHPESHEQFFEEFANECKKLNSEGVLISKHKIRKQFEVRLFCCDTPAKSFVTCTKSHNSTKGCHKCQQKGVYFANRMVFSKIAGVPRNNENFYNRADLDHHNIKYNSLKSCLELTGFNIVSQFPLDPLHLVDLGVSKKILTLILDLKKREYSQMNSDLINLSKFIPSEFNRKPRTLDELPRFKAVEYHLFIAYYGIVWLKPYLLEQENTEKYYYHFLLLFSAIKLLSHQTLAIENVKSAESLLKKFVLDFPDLYGQQFLNYNVHNLLHLPDCVRQYGHLHNFSSYKFENFLQIIKRRIKQMKDILPQVINRQKDLWNINNNNFVPKPNFRITEDIKDSCYMLEKNIPFRIMRSYINDSGQTKIVGHRFLNLADFFTHPFSSITYFNIFSAQNLSTVTEEFSIEQIAFKFMVLPEKNNFILIPILHTV